MGCPVPRIERDTMEEHHSSVPARVKPPSNMDGKKKQSYLLLELVVLRGVVALPPRSDSESRLLRLSLSPSLSSCRRLLLDDASRSSGPRSVRFRLLLLLLLLLLPLLLIPSTDNADPAPPPPPLPLLSRSLSLSRLLLPDADDGGAGPSPLTLLLLLLLGGATTISCTKLIAFSTCARVAPFTTKSLKGWSGVPACCASFVPDRDSMLFLVALFDPRTADTRSIGILNVVCASVAVSIELSRQKPGASSRVSRLTAAAATAGTGGGSTGGPALQGGRNGVQMRERAWTSRSRVLADIGWVVSACVRGHWMGSECGC